MVSGVGFRVRTLGLGFRIGVLGLEGLGTSDLRRPSRSSDAMRRVRRSSKSASDSYPYGNDDNASSAVSSPIDDAGEALPDPPPPPAPPLGVCAEWRGNEAGTGALVDLDRGSAP